MPNTPTRSVRVGPVWDRARDKAKRNGETMTAVIERLLADYVTGDTGWPGER